MAPIVQNPASLQPCPKTGLQKHAAQNNKQNLQRIFIKQIPPLKLGKGKFYTFLAEKKAK
jgi:hypothetical protein